MASGEETAHRLARSALANPPTAPVELYQFEGDLCAVVEFAPEDRPGGLTDALELVPA